MKLIRLTIFALSLFSCASLFAETIGRDSLSTKPDSLSSQSTTLSSGFLSEVEGQDTLRVNLQEALEIALSESPIVAVAEMEVKKKRYVKRGAHGALFPQIDAFGQYSRTIKKQTMYLDGDFPMGKKIDPATLPPHVKEILEAMGMLGANNEENKDGVQFGRSNLWTTGVSISMPLVVPVLWKTIGLSSIDVEVALEDARGSKLDLTDVVKRAYYTVLLAEDSYLVYRDMYDAEKDNLENIERKYKEGLVAEFDLISAQVRLQTIRPEMIQTDNALEMAKMQLKALMGIDLDIPIKVYGKLSDYQDNMFAEAFRLGVSAGMQDEVKGDEGFNSNENINNNSQLRKMDLQSKQLRKLYELKKAQFLPSLVANFKYNYMSQSNDFNFKYYRLDPFSTADITLSIPLFSGGKRTNEMRAAKISIDQLSVQRIDVERKIRLAIKNQLREIVKSIEQIQALNSTEEQAQRGYAIALKRYETGMGTLLELNQSSLSIANVRLQKNNAIYSYLAAKSELEKLLGKDFIFTD